MSTRSAPPLNDGTISDAQGVEVLTALPAPGSPTAYVPATLAAAAPVWFHAMSSGEYLWINSIQWSSATVVSPGVYSAYTETIGGMWAVLNTASRTFSPVPSYPVTMPLDTASDTCRVVGCASRPPGYLYVLSSVKDGSAHSGLLQHYTVSSSGSVQPLTEEVLATVGPGVTFAAGIRLVGPSLMIYGTDSQGRVYVARKDWSKVGTNKPSMYRRSTFIEVLGSSVGWQYHTGDGWSASANDLAPIQTTSGSFLTTAGPMSFASYRNRTVLTTVTSSGGVTPVYTANFWMSPSGRPFRPVGSQVNLGTGSQYVGNGLQFMPQLQANPRNPSLTVGGVVSGTPYCYTTKNGASGSQSLAVEWGLYTHS